MVYLASAFLETREGRGSRGQDTGLNEKLSSSKHLLQEYTLPMLIYLEILIKSMRCAREHRERYQRTSVIIVEGLKLGKFPHNLLHHIGAQSKCMCHFVLGSAMRLYILQSIN